MTMKPTTRPCGVAVRRALLVSLLATVLVLPGASATAQAPPEVPTAAFGFSSLGALGPQVLEYQASPGQSNIVVIEGDFDVPETTTHTWVARETGTTVDGGERILLKPLHNDPEACTNVDPFTVRCSSDFREGNESVLVHLGDGDDEAHIATACGESPPQEQDRRCRAEVHGGPGNDVIQANDFHLGGNFAHEPQDPRNSAVYGSDGNDRLYAGKMGSYLMGGRGNDQLFGAEADDRLFGESGNDYISARAGNDVAAGGYGRDDVFLGYGNDRAYMRDEWRDYVGGGPGTDRVRTDVYDTRANMEGTF